MYPAIMGSTYTMDWIKKERDMRDTFDKEKYDSHSTVLRCPGIFELYNRGFFIQQPYDVDFTYNLNENEIQYLHPEMERILGSGANEYYPEVKSFDLTFHTKKDDFLVDFPLRKDQLPYICNIKTGFRVLSPVPLLMMPIPYDDQDEWTASMGVLETNKNIEVNPQLYLNNYDGEDEKTWNIKSGQNIMFCVPLTDDKWVVENQLSLKDKIFLEVYRLVQTRANICPRNSNLGHRYSTIVPRMKKKLNDCWKTLWDN